MPNTSASALLAYSESCVEASSRLRKIAFFPVLRLDCWTKSVEVGAGLFAPHVVVGCKCSNRQEYSIRVRVGFPHSKLSHGNVRAPLLDAPLAGMMSFSGAGASHRISFDQRFRIALARFRPLGCRNILLAIVLGSTFARISCPT